MDNGIVVVLVTGSRKWDDIWEIKRALDTVAVYAKFETDADKLIVRHGACYPKYDQELGRRPFKSADYLAHLWCLTYGPEAPVLIEEQERPAIWDAPCRPACRPRKNGESHRTVRGGRSICPAAGNYRNVDMVKEEPQPNCGLAFIVDRSKGATHCMNIMREFSIPVDEFTRTSPPKPKAGQK